MALLASKWIHIAFVVNVKSFKTFLDDIGEMKFYNVSQVKPLDQLEISKEQYAQVYERYIDKTMEKFSVDLSDVRPILSCAMTRDENAVEFVELSPGRYKTTILKPIIQVQLHNFCITHDGQIKTMVFGTSPIYAGLQFSLPAMHLDPLTHAPIHTLADTNCKNAKLFRSIKRWVNQNTKPATFLFSEKTKIATFRLEDALKNKICHHPQMIEQGIAFK